MKRSVFLMTPLTPIPYKTLLQAAETTRSTVDLWLDASMDGFQALRNMSPIPCPVGTFQICLCFKVKLAGNVPGRVQLMGGSIWATWHQRFTFC